MDRNVRSTRRGEPTSVQSFRRGTVAVSSHGRGAPAHSRAAAAGDRRQWCTASRGGYRSPPPAPLPGIVLREALPDEQSDSLRAIPQEPRLKGLVFRDQAPRHLRLFEGEKILSRGEFVEVDGAREVGIQRGVTTVIRHLHELRCLEHSRRAGVEHLHHAYRAASPTNRTDRPARTGRGGAPDRPLRKARRDSRFGPERARECGGEGGTTWHLSTMRR